MALFGEPSPLEAELQDLDVANMTPLEAINALYHLQQRLKASSNGPGPRPGPATGPEDAASQGADLGGHGSRETSGA